MLPSSISSYRYSPPYQNSYECTGPASHSYKSPVSRTTNPDTHHDRFPSCRPNTPPAAALSLPPAPQTGTPPSPSPQICTTPRSQRSEEHTSELQSPDHLV